MTTGGLFYDRYFRSVTQVGVTSLQYEEAKRNLVGRWNIRRALAPESQRDADRAYIGLIMRHRHRGLGRIRMPERFSVFPSALTLRSSIVCFSVFAFACVLSFLRCYAITFSHIILSKIPASAPLSKSAEIE